MFDMSLVIVLLVLAGMAVAAIVIIALEIRLAQWRPCKNRDTVQRPE